MRMKQFASAIAVGALLSWSAGGSTASAADLIPVKAPPPAPLADQLDVHGFFDVTFLNDYITPRGLLVTDTGLTTQILSGLVLDVYKDKSGWINDISFNGGFWTDLWSAQNDKAVGPWNEFDWFVGVNVVFAKNWNFGVQYVDFIPPAADLSTSFPATEHNIEFSLSYDDTGWGWPVPLHPYAKLWYEISGPSVVVLGNRGGTYDVELGIVPTFDTSKYTGLPLVFTTPTWVTVGPTNFWNSNNGTTNFCGATNRQACALSNAGVFTTGVEGKLALTSVVPKRLGNWYVKGGVRYYYIINNALLAAQELTGSAGGAANVTGTYTSAHRDIGLVYAGLGFNF
jgi:hypothetical protein